MALPSFCIYKDNYSEQAQKALLFSLFWIHPIHIFIKYALLKRAWQFIF